MRWAFRIIVLLVGLAAVIAARGPAQADTLHPEPGLGFGPGPALGLGLGPAAGQLLLDDLDLSTTTDTLPGTEATQFQAMAGDLVRRVYILRNDGLLPLSRIAVHDPQAPEAALSCGHGGESDIDDLPPLSSTFCSATFTAQPGEHVATVTATAFEPAFQQLLSSSTQAGYTAVSAGLSARLSLGSSSPRAGTTVPATVTVTNTGTVTLDQVSVTAQAPLSRFHCGAGGSGGPELIGLPAGRSAACTGTLATAAGRHTVHAGVSGAWTWSRPITATGTHPAQAVPVEAGADASYTGVSSPAPTPRPRSGPPPPIQIPSPAPTAIPPPGQGASPGSGASPGPSTSRTPSPSPPGSPTASPTSAVLVANPQFPVSRGLSTPLKVLAIIIVPAIAVGRRAISSLRRR